MANHTPAMVPSRCQDILLSRKEEVPAPQLDSLPTVTASVFTEAVGHLRDSTRVAGPRRRVHPERRHCQPVGRSLPLRCAARLPELVTPFHLRPEEEKFNSCHMKFANCAASEAD